MLQSHMFFLINKFMFKNIKEIQQNLKKRHTDFKKLTNKNKLAFLEEISQMQAILQRYRQTMVNELEGRKIRIDTKLRNLHKRLKVNLFKYILTAQIRHLVSAPFIYMMIVPFIFLDIGLEIYHRVCFTLYGIPKVKRSNYILIDRHKLAYLNFMQKINCVYCGYGNGLMAYGKEIAGRTEKYWCPIKHAKEIPDPHSLYEDFFDYADGDGFINKKETKKDIE